MTGSHQLLMGAGGGGGKMTLVAGQFSGQGEFPPGVLTETGYSGVRNIFGSLEPVVVPGSFTVVAFVDWFDTSDPGGYGFRFIASGDWPADAFDSVKIEGPSVDVTLTAAQFFRQYIGAYNETWFGYVYDVGLANGQTYTVTWK